MDIHLAGSRPTRRAPPEYFTGTVLQDPIIQTEAPARLASTRVSFEPGARTAWHTHPLGQTLYVISGVGRVQAKGGPIREIRPGDVVWIPPGEKHWHGASPTNAMTYIAMQEAADGSYVTWMEHVTDAEYSAKLGSDDSLRRPGARAKGGAPGARTRRAREAAGADRTLHAVCQRDVDIACVGDAARCRDGCAIRGNLAVVDFDRHRRPAGAGGV